MSNDANALKRKEQIKKILVYGGMVMLCLVSFYFIFKPSKEQVQAEQQKVGFNAELPDPRGAGIEADKIAAYELEDIRVKQEQKMRTLEDFTAMTTDDEEEEVVEIPEEPRYTGGSGGSSYRGGSSSRSNSFSTSTSAYNDINATLGSFYEQPREDPEKEALKAELEELKQSMAQQQNSQPTYADQVALLEKSYELAAKYMPGGTAATSEGVAEEVETTTRSGKAKAQSVGHVTTPVVSALAQPVSDSVMIARMAQSVGGGFHTAVGEAPQQTARNTIKACVHGDQTIISGQSVRLRLLEAMRVGKYVLPRNTLITGEGSKAFGIQYLLRGLYTHNGLFYFHTQVKNTSNVPYEVDFVTFKIVDKQVMKRTAIQEQVIFPLRAYDYATTVAGNKDERTVFVFDKFTIPADKVLVVEMHEKSGGRHQTFTVESEDIVRAKVINELKVK